MDGDRAFRIFVGNEDVNPQIIGPPETRSGDGRVVHCRIVLPVVVIHHELEQIGELESGRFDALKDPELVRGYVENHVNRSGWDAVGWYLFMAASARYGVGARRWLRRRTVAPPVEWAWVSHTGVENIDEGIVIAGGVVASAPVSE